MSHNSKDKRTKDQILQLLQHALAQESLLRENISVLEAELSACQKKVENPIQTFGEEAFPSSKTSFRIDYYRTSDKGSLKGIVEHLPSRTHKSFSGDGLLIFSKFMAKFLPELAKIQTEISAGMTRNSVLSADAPIELPVFEPEPVKKVQAPHISLLNRLMGEFRESEC